MTRLRVLAGVLLVALAGWWAYEAAALARTARSATGTTLAALAGRPAGLDRLRAGEACPDCPHRAELHDPDVGCLGRVGGLWSGSWCTCRRLGCLCPKSPPPGDLR